MRGHHLATEKERIKVALSEDCLEKLSWLIEEQTKEKKKKVYPCEIIERLITNEYTIKKAFN